MLHWSLGEFVKELVCIASLSVASNNLYLSVAYFTLLIIQLLLYTESIFSATMFSIIWTCLCVFVTIVFSSVHTVLSCVWPARHCGLLHHGVWCPTVLWLPGVAHVSVGHCHCNGQAEIHHQAGMFKGRPMFRGVQTQHPFSLHEFVLYFCMKLCMRLHSSHEKSEV